MPDNANYGHLYEATLAQGSIACIQLLDHSKFSVGRLLQLRPQGFWKIGWNDSFAAQNGQLECLQYLHSKGWMMSHSSDIAAAAGSLACLQYIVENRRQYDWTLNAIVCAAAAENDRLECLKYLHEVNCPWNDDTGIAAAGRGSLRCLQYFFEHSTLRHPYICHIAALNGHLDCLQYAHSSGCPLVAPNTLSVPGQNGAYKRQFGVTSGPDHLVDLVAQGQHWDCVQYLTQNNYSLTRTLTAQLAHYGKDCLLAQAVSRGCPLAGGVSIRFARVGNIEQLRTAHEQGCPWSNEVCVAAARGGHLHCLQYAHEHGCPWDKKVLLVAKKKGYVEIVEYARANGCPSTGKR